MAPQRLRTPEQVRRWFSENGISQAEWSRKHGFSAWVVRDLLRGKRHGLRGEAHRAAIALRLKPEPKDTQL